MIFRRLIRPFVLIATLAGGMMLGNQGHAQERSAMVPATAAARSSLFDTVDQGSHPSQSNVGSSGMTPQELRTARAIYRTNQRIARLEQNLWMGYEPLRPRWNAIPMMSTRYTNPKFYVPVYVYNR